MNPIQRLTESLRDPAACRTFATRIAALADQPLTIMEVCGGHTMAMQRHGIPALLPPTLRLISGPGCPVCVTDLSFIDHVIALSRLPDVTIATYGDLLRIPGSSSTLAGEKARGADIRLIYSTLEAVTLAQTLPARKIVFPGIGFETTAPATAIALFEASRRHLDNFFVLSAHKVMPPAMAALIDEGVGIDGYLCPGHVSVVTGSAIYEPIATRYAKPCVISGFEPLDMLQSLYMIALQIRNSRAEVEIQYTRAVKPEGNPRARKAIEQAFIPEDQLWRGLGVISQSGLGIAPRLAAHDARHIPCTLEKPRERAGCICGSILKGLKSPHDCALFGHACTPAQPVGACMVSQEGSCAASYRYHAYAR
jgi:hydrogenase expression/formation protein HypD